MKKLAKILPTASFVLIVFAFISFVWSYQQNGMAAKELKYDEIVVLENAEYNEENEGKLVATYANLQLQEPAVDTDYNLKVNCAILYRKVEMYQYYLSNDSVYKKYLGYSGKNIKGLHGEKYNNPEFPEEYKSKVMLGKVFIGDGELFLGQGLLETLIKTYNQSENKFVQLDPDITIPGFTKDDEGVFSNSKSDNPAIGDIRINYQYLTLNSLGKVLIVGKQQGREIVPAEDSFSTIDLSSKTLEELKENNLSDHSKDAKMLAYVAVVELAVAAAVFVVSLVRSKKRRAF